MIQRLFRPPVGIALSLLALIALGGALLAALTRNGTDTDNAQDRPSPAFGAHADARAGIPVDRRRQQLIGVRTTRVVRGSLAKTIGAVGMVRHDESRLIDVNLKVEGWIRDVYVSYVGQPVKAGQPLIAVFSPELDALQTNLLGALRAREQTPVAQSADGSQHADRLVDTPRQRLRQFDLAEEELQALEAAGRLPSAVVFRSPMNGVVLEKSVIKGMHATAGQMLYRIADLSVVVVEADFRETDALRLKPGAQAEVTADALPGERFSGRIVSMHPYVSEQTRTLKARIELPNRAGRLKPGAFVTVDVPIDPGEGLLVPVDAVVNSGSRQIVFLAQGQGHFEPREVTVGARSDGHALIVAGLHEHDEVAARATFFLDSESQMRAALEDYQAGNSSMGAPEDPVRFDLRVQTTPNPPRAGKNVVEVRIRDAEARPVTDADVRVLFSMAPMPSMNMPAMRSEARLTHAGTGVYRGPATLSMSGRWDVDVTALRQGRSIVKTRTSLVAR